ncbi:MAG: hypothetical protein JSS14_22695 [Proteobacteria bacterium]|nr:hypothetical protein [Pseudomonadota bacterium]
MDEQLPIDGPTRLALALGFGRAPQTAAGVSGTVGAAASSSSGSAGAEQDAAAGLDIDDVVDPNAGAGRDGARRTDMKYLPGNGADAAARAQPPGDPRGRPSKRRLAQREPRHRWQSRPLLVVVQILRRFWLR